MSGFSRTTISFSCHSLANFPIPLMFQNMIFILNLFFLVPCSACSPWTFSFALVAPPVPQLPPPSHFLLRKLRFLVFDIPFNCYPPPITPHFHPQEHVFQPDFSVLSLCSASAIAALASSSNFIALITSCTSPLSSPRLISQQLANSSRS